VPIVKGPLFSATASGTFRGMIEFRTVGTATRVAGKRTAPRTRTAAQQVQSARFAAAVQGWQRLDAAAKGLWKAAAAASVLTGYQLYLREYQRQAIVPPDQPNVP